MLSKYQSMLAEADVSRWYNNVSRGSKVTGDVYLRRLGNFCASHGLTPSHLARLDPKALHRLLLDTVTRMESEGYAGGYIASVIKSVKSWLAFNEVEIKGLLKIRGVHDTPTLHDERVPSQAELRRILLAADEKGRLICSLVAYSGLRLEVMGNYDGTDGLTVRDLPEMEINGREVSFRSVPTMVRVRPTLSKKAHEYFSFLGSEGCDYLKEYLELRIRNGETLDERSPIITPKIADKDFIRTTNIGDAARKAIRKAGFAWRPYVLRSYFDTQMMLAESKGLVIRDYRAFFMGHKGDIEAVYTLNKRRLPPDVVESMRKCYARTERYLQTVSSAHEPDLPRAFKEQLLLVAGFRADEITEEHLDLDEEKFHRLVRERLAQQMRNNHAGQHVVEISEVDMRLRQGWQFIGLLPNNKAILRQPDAA